MSTMAPGTKLRLALSSECPLQVVGTVNAYCGLLARRAGFKALYVSGAGVANSSFGIPDLGLTTLDEVATDVRRLAAVVDLPILVDADTG
jgi:methylisocitrate lyase